jgi:hypothetical protein
VIRVIRGGPASLRFNESTLSVKRKAPGASGDLASSCDGVLPCQRSPYFGGALMSILPPPATLLAVTVSPEVHAYTSKHGIEAPLQRLVEATPRIYPTATSIKVYMEQDVEDSDLWFIVFEVFVPSADIPDYVAAQRPWGEEWMRAYPPPRMHSFVLSLERAQA